MAQAKKVRRVRKKTAPAKNRAECKWCRRQRLLDSNGRIRAHQSDQSKDNWPYKHVEPSRCPGSGVDPKDWIPKPVPTHPQHKSKKKKSKTKRVSRKVS